MATPLQRLGGLALLTGAIAALAFAWERARARAEPTPAPGRPALAP